MIISRIIGGLGNQMFQYAAGRCIAMKCETPLLLDISDFENYQLHQGFELERVFNCPVEIAVEADVRGILRWQHLPHIRRLLSRRNMQAFRRKEFVVEPHFQYWGGINNISSNGYLEGYWQSEKYFMDVDAQIRSDFTFRAPLENPNADLAEQIKSGNAVSLHVRRGDYANNPKTTATHGLCSLEYYQSAMEFIVESVDQPILFIFSDDIDWVKNNFKLKFPCQYVVHNQGAESYNDMLLMSLCQHHIIANSSFSWWGAWLNSKMDKIVIAPKNWFANETDTRDLFPQGWILL